jgi:hypothetical protein
MYIVIHVYIPVHIDCSGCPGARVASIQRSTRAPKMLPGIQASYFHTCGLTINGSVFCWGNNDAEQLNVPAATDGKVRFLSSGFAHNCVIQDTGDCPSVPPRLLASILMNFPRHLDTLINSVVNVYSAVSIVFLFYTSRFFA